MQGDAKRRCWRIGDERQRRRLPQSVAPARVDLFGLYSALPRVVHTARYAHARGALVMGQIGTIISQGIRETLHQRCRSPRPVTAWVQRGVYGPAAAGTQSPERRSRLWAKRVAEPEHKRMVAAPKYFPRIKLRCGSVPRAKLVDPMERPRTGGKKRTDAPPERGGVRIQATVQGSQR